MTYGKLVEACTGELVVVRCCPKNRCCCQTCCMSLCDTLCCLSYTCGATEAVAVVCCRCEIFPVVAVDTGDEKKPVRYEIREYCTCYKTRSEYLKRSKHLTYALVVGEVTCGFCGDGQGRPVLNFKKKDLNAAAAAAKSLDGAPAVANAMDRADADDGKE